MFSSNVFTNLPINLVRMVAFFINFIHFFMLFVAVAISMEATEQELITHHDLCLVMKNSNLKFTDFKQQQVVLRQFVLCRLGLRGQFSDDSEEVKDLDEKLKSFLAHAINRYRRECCKFEQLLTREKHSEFLKNVFPLPPSLLQALSSSDEESPMKPTSKKRLKAGRKPLTFQEKSIRGQQLASAKIRGEHEPEAILKAASQQPTDLGKLVRRSNSTTGITASRALEAIRSPLRQGKECLLWVNHVARSISISSK
jgi:hypothetical protein